jgi:uncharacterized protein (TIGR02246 family)
MSHELSEDVQALYRQLLGAWNERNAQGMADLFLEEGELIGYDGSHIIGSADIYSHLAPIFEHHLTASFVSIVKSVRELAPGVALLRAIVGMAPHGKSELNPDVNAHQTLVAVKRNETWRIQLFQNTPAQFHGRPELAEQMTEELKQQLR